VEALPGICVLDFSSVLAGPLCTQYLSDLGAEVIKVESPSTGDEMRWWKPQRGELSSAFLSVNRNKRSVAVDLKTEAGRAIVYRLAESSDVVVESASRGVSQRLGIDYETLKAINPRIVYCSISGYGRTGPMADARGYDMVVQAYSGMMSLSGEPDGRPVRSAFSPIDQTTGLNAVIGILAGLMRRGITGHGTSFEVSLFETAVGLLGWNLQKYWETGEIPARAGSGHESLCPYQAFDTADAPVLLGVANDAIWQRFCAAVEAPALAEDPRFATNPRRVDHMAETVAAVSQILVADTREAWVRRLGDAGVPCSPVNDLEDLYRGEQTAAREILLQYEHPELGSLGGVALPIQFEAEKRGLRSPPPFLGQHTEEVLDELGYDAGEIEKLTAAGIVRTRSADHVTS
jgi:crotonobetainyl-CoA:carnitine CoA-transferase CaiB-like acyl-CoA transferase